MLMDGGLEHKGGRAAWVALDAEIWHNTQIGGMYASGICTVAYGLKECCL